MKGKLFSGILLLGCLLLACTKTPKQLVYQDVKNFRLLSLSLTPDIGMDLQLYNPNTYPLTLKDANINVFINDKRVGIVSLMTSFSVPANDTFLLPVKLQADLTNIFANAYSILSNKPVDVHLQGSIKAGRGIYLNIPINYQTKLKLNVVDF
jgi:LEA14-like dessication related protein